MSKSSAVSGSIRSATRLPRFGTIEARSQNPARSGFATGVLLAHDEGGRIAEVDVMDSVPRGTGARPHHDQLLFDDEKRQTGRAPLEAPGTEALWHDFSVTIEPAGNGVRFLVIVDGTVTVDYIESENLDWYH
ncbi:MAG: hypothetical protein R2706_13635 [Acidimicrobiales bacterium]